MFLERLIRKLMRAVMHTSIYLHKRLRRGRHGELQTGTNVA